MISITINNFPVTLHSMSQTVQFMHDFCVFIHSISLLIWHATIASSLPPPLFTNSTIIIIIKHMRSTPPPNLPVLFFILAGWCLTNAVQVLIQTVFLFKYFMSNACVCVSIFFCYPLNVSANWAESCRSIQIKLLPDQNRRANRERRV